MRQFFFNFLSIAFVHNFHYFVSLDAWRGMVSAWCILNGGWEQWKALSKPHAQQNFDSDSHYIQGVSNWSVFFNLPLRERNIQVRLYLKVVLKSWDVDILIIRTNFQKSNIGWPQQPPTEKVQKLKKYISWFH